MGYSPWSRKELDTTERLHFKRVTNTQGSNVGSTTCLLFDFGQVLWLLRVSAASFVKWKQCLYWPRRVAGTQCDCIVKIVAGRLVHGKPSGAATHVLGPELILTCERLTAV